MITIAGAGVAGLACAYELAQRGAAVTVYEACKSLGETACSRFAGGMLAPWCEGESADPQVVTLGQGALEWWAKITDVTRRGTLVVAPPRDSGELTRFSRRSTQHQVIGEAEIAALEPALSGRYQRGLFFDQEGHLDPRQALNDLATKVQTLGVKIRYGCRAPAVVDVDCTGVAAALPDLRPVRGEMALLQAPEVEISRTIRLLHPRIPLYLVPRGGGLYMIGATMIESSSPRPVTLRSLMELLGAAFTLHPGFGEAAVIETGVGLRPAFASNLPQLVQRGDTIHLNGLYRHGFLLAPALAAQLATRLTSETTDEHHRKRQTA